MKPLFVSGIAAVALALSACSQSAPTEAAPQAEAAAPSIVVEDAWVAASPQGVAIAAGYVTLRNGGAAADRLVSVSSARAPRAELHTMTMNDGVMQMRPVEAIDIPAQGQASLAPGGDHIMFLDLAEPFTAGETVPVTLNFATQGPVTVDFAVRDRAATHGAQH